MNAAYYANLILRSRPINTNEENDQKLITRLSKKIIRNQIILIVLISILITLNLLKLLL